MQRNVPNVYRSHARSGEGFGQPPTQQKKCNQPYLEPVKSGSGMESGISFQELMHYNDAETRRWREFLEQDCDALDDFSKTRCE
jgi:hypothetical protein